MKKNTIRSKCAGILLTMVVLVATSPLSLGTEAASSSRQTRFSPFWTNIEDCQTTMHLRNNLMHSRLSVQPVLYTETGEAIRLDPVTLAPSASTEIAVNETVRNLGYVGPLFGGAEFHFDAAYPGALSVETEVIQQELNFAYSVESFAAKGRVTNEQHAVFSRPTRTTEVFFSVYNSSDQEVAVAPTVISGNRTIELDRLVVPSHGLSKVRLSSDDVRGGLSSVGGIVLRHRGPAGALFTTGWLDDAETGYSTMMTFEEFTQTHGRTELFGVQILTSYVNSDIVLKNLSDDVVRAAAEFYSVAGGTVGTSAYDIGVIRPGAITAINIEQLQKRGVLPDDVDELSVRIRYSGRPGALMGRVFGVSRSGTYGYYTQLEDRTSARRSEIYWSAKAGTRTLATIANFGSDDSVTIELFNSVGEAYSTRIKLRANEAATIDLAKHGAEAFGIGASGGWNVSRHGAGALVVKNNVVDDAGFSLPFYGAPNYITEVYLTKVSLNLDSDNPTDTTQSRKRWSDGPTDPTYSGTSSTSNSSISTISSSPDINSYWTVTGQGPGSTNVEVDVFIPSDEAEFGEETNMMAQASTTNKCFITFVSLTKDTEGKYDAVIGVDSETCGDSQPVSIGLTPLCVGNTWSYSGNGSQTITKGQSEEFNIEISKTGGATVSCAHRFTPSICSSCTSTPAFRDGVASAY